MLCSMLFKKRGCGPFIERFRSIVCAGACTAALSLLCLNPALATLTPPKNFLSAGLSTHPTHLSTLDHPKAYSPKTSLIKTLPPVFMKNVGQLPSQIKYYQAGSDGVVIFADDGVVFNTGWSNTGWNASVEQGLNQRRLGKTLRRGNRQPTDIATTRNAIKLSFVGKSSQSKILAREIGSEPLLARHDENREHAIERSLNAYEQIIYKNAYPGIDIHFHRKTLSLSYDIIVRPEGDPDDIVLAINETPDKTIDPNIQNKTESYRLPSAIEEVSVYQYINNRKVTIKAAYKSRNIIEATTGETLAMYSVKVGEYNKMVPLIINFW